MTDLNLPVTLGVFVLMVGFFLFLHWAGRRIRANNATGRPKVDKDWEGVRVKANGKYLDGNRIGTFKGYGRATQMNKEHEQWYPAWLIDVDGSNDRLWMKAESLERETFFHYNFRRHGFGKTSWPQFAFVHGLLLLGIIRAGWPMIVTTVVIDAVWIFWGNRRNFNNKQG